MSNYNILLYLFIILHSAILLCIGLQLIVCVFVLYPRLHEICILVLVSFGPSNSAAFSTLYLSNRFTCVTRYGPINCGSNFCPLFLIHDVKFPLNHKFCFGYRKMPFFMLCSNYRFFHGLWYNQ